MSRDLSSIPESYEELLALVEIGRASCRERVKIRVVGVALKKKTEQKRAWEKSV